MVALSHYCCRTTFVQGSPGQRAVRQVCVCTGAVTQLLVYSTIKIAVTTACNTILATLTSLQKSAEGSSTEGTSKEWSLQRQSRWCFMMLIVLTFLVVVCGSSCALSAVALVPSLLWHGWLGVRKSIQPVKIEWWGIGVVICLKRGADFLHMVQLMPLHPKTTSSLASFKSRLVLPFWYQLTQVVLEKRPLLGVVAVIVVVCANSVK